MPRVHLGALLRSQHGYAILLGLVATSAIFTVAAPDTDAWHLGNVLIQAAIVLVAVWTAGSRRSVRVTFGAAALLAVAASLISLASDSNSSRDFAILAATLTALVPVVVVRGLIRALRDEGASERVIAGALSLYLLIGMLCAYVYAAIAELDSGPLFADGKGDGSLQIYVYFSFITQTTVGYGDYTPANPVARSVAMTEALLGQLYLVTVISLLVGGFLGRARRASGD